MVAVFWLMSVLALAVFAAVRVVGHDVDIVTSQIHGSRARQLAEMGVAVASNPVVEPDDPILRQSFEDGTEGFTARISSEAMRFNINAILLGTDNTLLLDIFDYWDMPIEEAQALVDALEDWVDGNDTEQLNGAEAEYYAERGQPNFPFNRPFYDLDEMRLVRGMANLESYQPDWRDWFTIWSSQAAIDINDAAPDLIAAAAQVRLDEAQQLVDFVRGPDGIRYTEDDEPFTSVDSALQILNLSEINAQLVSNRFTTNDRTVRIESTGRSESARRRITVILRSRTGQPEILSREEDITP